MQMCLSTVELCGHCEPQLGPYEEKSNFPSCSACKKILCGKSHGWEQLQGCKILMLWNIKMQDLDFWRC